MNIKKNCLLFLVVSMSMIAQNVSDSIAPVHKRKNIIRVSASTSEYSFFSVDFKIRKLPKVSYERFISKKLSLSAELYFGRENEGWYSLKVKYIYMLTPQLKYYMLSSEKRDFGTRLYVSARVPMGYEKYIKQNTDFKDIGIGLGFGYQNYIFKRIVYNFELCIDYWGTQKYYDSPNKYITKQKFSLNGSVGLGYNF